MTLDLIAFVLLVVAAALALFQRSWSLALVAVALALLVVEHTALFGGSPIRLY